MKVIPVVLETLSITRIGSSGVYFDYSSADIVTYKIPFQANDIYYIPAIPATSFKGLLRSTYERYLRRSGNIAGEEFKKKLEDRINKLEDKYKKFLHDNENSLAYKLCDEISKFYYAGMLSGEKPSSLNIDFSNSENCKKIVKENKIEEVLKKLLLIYFDVTGYNPEKACYSTSDFDRCENISIIEDQTTKCNKTIWMRITGRNPICEVCKVFGTSGIRGYVKFTDLIAIDPFPVLLERLTHVAINRVTGTAEEHKLFTEEVIPAGVKFLGFLLVLDDSKLEKVKEALYILRKKAERGEVWIGGRGTSGYGNFKLYIYDDIVSINFLGHRMNVRLKISEPNPPTLKIPLLEKLFPPLLLSSLEVVEEGKFRLQLLDENNAVLGEYDTLNEAEKAKEELEKQGKKVRIVPRGVMELL
ncbi:RAMP superfamily CRISPR-associated protein [Sulfurisphaera javensis]|uniref:RAMP superfamily CRISPR-associated protein n=1 Tax=Sulfurisphaera javensis TaxID=2049879 RepID=A0AAT9GV01_9CREN